MGAIARRLAGNKAVEPFSPLDPSDPRLVNLQADFVRIHAGGSDQNLTRAQVYLLNQGFAMLNAGVSATEVHSRLGLI